MSFGLRDLKKHRRPGGKVSYHRHLVVGEDIFSLSLYHRLWCEHGPGEVVLLAKAVDWKFSGPKSLRGQDNIDAFKRLCPQVSLRMCAEEPLFYKQSGFHPFGGAIASEKLCFAEKFFTLQGAGVDGRELFPCLADTSFLEQLSPLEQSPLELEESRPEDLINPAHYRLFCSDGSSLECQELYWGLGPGKLLEVYRQADADLAKFCRHIRSSGVLHVRYEFAGPIAPAELGNGRTLFFPLSYTHQWGHFIGEFKDSEVLELMAFYDPDETSEEEISKKIKILGRNLEKIFPDFKKEFRGRFIRLEDSGAALEIDDGYFERLKKNHPHLNFVGMNAPLAEGKPGLSFLARGLASVSAEAQA